jgi:uncharacterized protein YjbI with pentapeptide repeats
LAPCLVRCGLKDASISIQPSRARRSAEAPNYEAMTNEKVLPTQRDSWIRRHWRPTAATGIFLVLVYVVAATTVLPPWIVSLSAGGADDNTRLNAVTNTRSALLSLLAPLAVVVGGVAALLNYRANSAQTREQLQLQRRGQVTERFTKAIEQLGQSGANKCDVRIGAAYALEQIASDSPELHWPIMEVLCTFVRHRSSRGAVPQHRLPAPSGDDGEAAHPSCIRPPEPDVQAALTVIGRRNPQQDVGPIRLYGANMDGADLSAANLRNADLRQTSLRATTLHGADLREASLFEADLNGAYLHGANMQTADLRLTNMQHVWANRTDLRRARFWGADLRNADLHQADLRHADLSRKVTTGVSPPGANYYATHWQEPYPAGWMTTEHRFPSVKMTGAVVLGAQLQGADLRGAEGLTHEQLVAAADFSDALLPDYLQHPLNQVHTEPTTQATNAPSGNDSPRDAADR